MTASFRNGTKKEPRWAPLVSAEFVPKVNLIFYLINASFDFISTFEY